MKIAIIGSRGYPYVYSGYETFVSEVAPRLTEKGIEIHVYCHKQLFKEKPENVKGIYLHYIPCLKTKSLSQLSNSFLSTVHAVFHNYDVLLYVNSANGIFGVLTKLFRKKTAINVDGLEWLRPKWKGLGAKVFYFSSKMATKWMDEIITDAEGMRQVYLKEFHKDSTVIAYGANLGKSKNPQLLEQWNLKPHSYYLVVGRLIPDNNALIIIQEFIKSAAAKKLVIVGDVPYRDKYAENIKMINDERIIFTGYITNSDVLAELYHNCYSYIHGHEFGGTNPTLLKALAYGCAILALDTVFNREVLNDKEHGFYFTKNNLHHLIADVDNNETLLIPLRAKAKQRIEENYTWEKITAQYFHLFYKLSNNKENRM